MLQRLRNRQKGFTLIELLIVVAIIGIIAAILIPNLIDALQKAKQKRTMADMRNVGTAFMSYVTDAASAGAAGATFTWGDYAQAASAVTAYASIQSILRPSTTFFYMNEVPAKDGWKYSFHWAYTGDPVSSQVMAIGSGARGGGFGASWVVGPFTATDYDQDIVWADGFFVRWPGGITN